MKNIGGPCENFAEASGLIPSNEDKFVFVGRKFRRYKGKVLRRGESVGSKGNDEYTDVSDEEAFRDRPVYEDEIYVKRYGKIVHKIDDDLRLARKRLEELRREERDEAKERRAMQRERNQRRMEEERKHHKASAANTSKQKKEKI